MNRLLKLLHLKKTKKDPTAPANLPKCLIHMPSMMMMDILDIDTSYLMPLTDMPELVIDKILKYSDFRSVQNLRKTCRAFRDHIDFFKQEFNHDQIKIQMELNRIIASYGSFAVVYSHEDTGCNIITLNDNKSRFLKSTDYIHAFARDLELVSQHQKSILQSFFVRYGEGEVRDFTRLLESVERVLKSRKPLLKAKEVSFAVIDEENILAVLPYIAPNVLDTIIILNYNLVTTLISLHFSRLRIKRIMKLEQWKKADKILMPTFRIDESIENFMHCSEVSISVETVTRQELMRIKDSFFNSTKLQKFELIYGMFFENVQFFEELGPFNIDVLSQQVWHFHIPGTEHVLEIVYNGKSVGFGRYALSDIPEHVLIQ